MGGSIPPNPFQDDNPNIADQISGIDAFVSQRLTESPVFATTPIIVALWKIMSRSDDLYQEFTQSQSNIHETLNKVEDVMNTIFQKGLKGLEEFQDLVQDVETQISYVELNVFTKIMRLTASIHLWQKNAMNILSIWEDILEDGGDSMYTVPETMSLIDIRNYCDFCLITLSAHLLKNIKERVPKEWNPAKQKIKDRLENAGRWLKLTLRLQLPQNKAILRYSLKQLNN